MQKSTSNDGIKVAVQEVYSQLKQLESRLLWIMNNGPIPRGSEIHHMDGDHSNNAIDNLELVRISWHDDYHQRLRTDDANDFTKYTTIELVGMGMTEAIRKTVFEYSSSGAGNVFISVTTAPRR